MTILEGEEAKTMTNKEKDKIIYESLHINRWYKWKARLKRRFNNIATLMVLYCIGNGLIYLGFRNFWISLGLFSVIEIIRSIVVHIYYTVRRLFKKRRKVM